jgi:hypothetical protein
MLNQLQYISKHWIKPRLAILPCLLALILPSQVAWAQKVSFSGTARNLLENNFLNRSDTVNPDRNASGYTLADLNFNIRPNAVTEISAQMRMRNEYGGYWGDGASITFRQLYMKGIIANRLRYTVGDLNYKLTPYTFFNPDGDGQINEAGTFRMFRELVEYDNFNQGNTWRQQGLMTEIRLHDEKLFDTLTVNGFIGRNRGNNLADLADIIQSAGKVQLQLNRFIQFGGNYAQLFALGQGRLDTTIFNNVIGSGNWNFQNDGKRWKYWFSGEAGASSLVFTKDPEAPKAAEDYFYEGQIGLNDKDLGLTFTGTWREVGPEFFSAAAQTKRINFRQSPLRFPTVGNEKLARPLSTWDLMRDNGLYNQTISPTLMAYDPRLGVARPFGLATPNRRGINLTVKYIDFKKIWSLGVEYAGLSEVQAEGTQGIKRNFGVFSGKGSLALGRWLNMKRTINLSSGYQFEQVQRGGTPLESVKLSNQMLDAGLEVEVLPQLDLMLGYRQVKSEGNEYLNVRNSFNIITQYQIYQMKSTEEVLGYGIRYRFSQFAYVALQGHRLSLTMTRPQESRYGINQFFCLFNMQF